MTIYEKLHEPAFSSFSILIFFVVSAATYSAQPDLLVFDSDGEQSLDVLVFGAEGPPEIASLLQGSEFILTPLLSGPARSRAAASGDFDRDGDQDLVFFAGHATHYVINKGGGHFESLSGAESIFSNGKGSALKAADVDGNGWTDFFAAIQHDDDTGSELRFLTQPLVPDDISSIRGKQRFCCVVDQVLALEGDFLLISPGALALATFDGQVRSIIKIGNGVLHAGLADIDNDGDQDIVSVAADNTLEILLNHGDRRFAPAKLGVTGFKSVEQFTLADFDNDGNIDLVLLAAGELIFLTGDGRRGFTPREHPISGLQVAETSRLVAHDLNFDGAPELLLLGVDGGLRILPGEPGENLWIGLRLLGYQNADPRGARVSAVRKSGVVVGRTLDDGDTVVLGLGRLAQLDAVVIDWPQGVTTYTQTTSNNRYLQASALGMARGAREHFGYGKPIQFRSKRTLECR